MVAMKTLSRRFWFVGFGIIVIVAVGGCCCLQSILGIALLSYCLDIGNMRGGQYIKWKQPDFDNALARICDHQGTYDLYVLLHDTDDPIHPYKPCPSTPRNIRTVKVTKSRVADNRVIGQAAANDPNVMHRVQSPDPSDIKAVLNALQP